MSDFNYTTGWEDAGSALIEELECVCGNVILEEDVINSAYYLQQEISCKDCGREFEANWKGMIIEEVEE